MVLTIQNHVEINHMLQLFEGECVPDFERLKVELLKEEVSSLAPPLPIWPRRHLHYTKFHLIDQKCYSYRPVLIKFG